MLSVLSGALFVAAAVLFLLSAHMRRKVDGCLGRAGNVDRNTPALGLFTPWHSGSRAPLAVPDRRWTYDQDYMVAFIAALGNQEVAAKGGAQGALAYYAREVLALDMWFVVALGGCVACAAMWTATWAAAWRLWPLWLVCAALGLLYAAADVAEGWLLRRILEHAQPTAGARVEATAGSADAAQVDAACALTRLKLIALTASVIGVLAFVVLLALDSIGRLFQGPTSRTPRPNTTGKGGTVGFERG
jgi:hypothetical protein